MNDQFAQLVELVRRDRTLQRYCDRAIYIKLSDAKVARTEATLDGSVAIDFDADNAVVGLEILGPPADDKERNDVQR